MYVNVVINNPFSSTLEPGALLICVLQLAKVLEFSSTIIVPEKHLKDTHRSAREYLSSVRNLYSCCSVRWCGSLGIFARDGCACRRWKSMR